MTTEELYKRTKEEMTRCYESGIKCMETADSKRSVRFFRDYTEGEIDGIGFFSQTMYLAVIYDYASEDEEEESKGYKNYCRKIQERTSELTKLIRDYERRFN